ncbi:MAG: YjiG family protein [Spirochaetes bacterium]|nr:YjiG family protein [Spirochaetota bacterium]
MASKSLPDTFVEGAKKGWTIWSTSTLPNVLMAFVIIRALEVSGMLGLLGRIFGPVMAVFALPGEAVMVLVGAFMSIGGGVGVAVGLYTAGTLDQTHVTILLPAIFLMGGLIQFAGRCLGTAEVQQRYYPVLFAICIANAVISMFIMRIFV